jgi:hypothetical protein
VIDGVKDMVGVFDGVNDIEGVGEEVFDGVWEQVVVLVHVGVGVGTTGTPPIKPLPSSVPPPPNQPCNSNLAILNWSYNIKGLRIFIC